MSVANQDRPDDPRAWNHPKYNWPFIDRQVLRASAAGQQAILSIQEAPSWATASGVGHIERPKLHELADFAFAAATRYDGTKRLSDGTLLPRVRFWQVWNEPNRGYFLSPQVVDGHIVAADHYRGMVAVMGEAVRSVHTDNRVVAGGLAPLARKNHPSPLGFMRALLCLTPELTRGDCDLRSNPIELDIWAHHPYTPGAPTRKARGGGDVMISGLPKLKRTLQAAIRLGHVRTRGPVELWATEFAWDSAPPDPQALPMKIHARWTAEALYRMWLHGVTTVTWFLVQDEPMTESRYQSGVYTVRGQRKRSFTAFRFPVVAFKATGGIRVWGRTPFGKPGRVAIYVRANGSWRRVARLGTTKHGIFRATVRTGLRGPVKATFGREHSLPFSLKPVADRYVEPFGSPLRPG